VPFTDQFLNGYILGFILLLFISYLLCFMEPLVGIEPTTCSLRVSCSTPEPQRQSMPSDTIVPKEVRKYLKRVTTVNVIRYFTGKFMLYHRLDNG
jgi:hypothetical protein